MSAGLCSVAKLTVDPSISTGSSTARGAMMPVRPTFHSTPSRRVTFSTAGSLYAMAQRGARVPEPASRWSAARSALMTTPSIPKGNEARSEATSSIRAWASSTDVTVRGATAVSAAVWTPSPAAWARVSLCGSSAGMAAGSPGAGSATTPYAKNVISTV